MKKTYTCKTCKSNKVQVDAWAIWDTENQCWKLGEMYNNCHCEDCGGETQLEEKTLPV